MPRIKSRKKSWFVGLLPHRTSRQWIVRGQLALLVSACAFFSTSSSWAVVIDDIDPESAYALAPINGLVAASYAERNLRRSASEADRAIAVQTARHALKLDPTATDALNVLGVSAQLNEQSAQVRSIYRYSLILSRRELQPQLWAIEDAVDRGDIEAALSSYDLALRTSRNAPDILMPNLVNALEEPALRAALLDNLREPPVWTEEFLVRAVRSRRSPSSVLTFLNEGRSIPLPVTQSMREELIISLFRVGELDTAWALYKEVRDAPTRNRSSDPEFKLSTKIRTVFDWRIPNETSFSAGIFQEEGSGILDFSVPPGVGGEVVRQTMLLPAGTYRLEGRSRDLSIDDSGRPYWRLICEKGHELGRVEVPNSSTANGQFSGTFIVPSDCQAQTLTLVIRPTDDISGISGQVTRAAIVPISEMESSQT